jgi:hypothetical protein
MMVYRGVALFLRIMPSETRIACVKFCPQWRCFGGTLIIAERMDEKGVISLTLGEDCRTGWENIPGSVSMLIVSNVPCSHLARAKRGLEFI